MAARERRQARMVAGLANHRRIEIVRLLLRGRSLCVNETAIEHLHRLHEAGLIAKKSQGLRVLLSPTKGAKGFIKAIDSLLNLAGSNKNPKVPR